MQKGPQHCNVVSSGVSGVVVTDVVVSVVSGNAWPPCAAAVDGSSLETVTLSELEKAPTLKRRKIIERNTRNKLLGKKI